MPLKTAAIFTTDGLKLPWIVCGRSKDEISDLLIPASQESSIEPNESLEVGCVKRFEWIRR